MEMMIIIITIISIQMGNHRADDAENKTELQDDYDVDDITVESSRRAPDQGNQGR